jgi:hypothetical protein
VYEIDRNPHAVEDVQQALSILGRENQPAGSAA